MEFELLLMYLFFGVLGGILSGLLGVGGGIIFIPLFDHIFRSHGVVGEELVRFILANSFLAILFAGISSSWRHWKMGNFYAKEVLSIAIPATIFGSGLSTIITHSSWYREVYFKLIFIFVILFTLWRTWRSYKSNTNAVNGKYSCGKYVFIGIATGIISAVSGLGGGVAMIPLLTIFGNLDIKKASAISISVIPIMVIPFLIIYGLKVPEVHFAYSVGYLQFLFILPVIIGIFIGSPLGVRFAQRMKSRDLQLIFAILLIIIVVKYSYELLSIFFN